MSKSIFIIGMGPGIGAATAERFGREGWTVVIGGRRASTLDGFVADLAAKGVTVHPVTVDATKPTELRAAMAEADRLSGGLTAVLSNVGYVREQDLFSMTDEEIDSDLAVNIGSGLHTIRAAVALFGSRGGTILLTGGGFGVHPSAAWASLGAGKAAIRNVVQGLANDLSADGIRIAVATVATLVSPDSTESKGVADLFWTLATDPSAGWEGTYPPAA